MSPLTFHRGDAALITPPALSSLDPNVYATGRWMLHSVWPRHHVGIVRSILPDDDVRFLSNVMCPCTDPVVQNKVLVTGGEDGRIHLWNNANPFPQPPQSFSVAKESMDIDTDVKMDMDSDTQESPSARARKKRDRDSDEQSVRTLVRDKRNYMV